MAFDPYAPCPCGSGKKFKWCCQPIHEEIDRAFRQEEEGQHETALKLMNEVVAKHPDNPEAWGRKALDEVFGGESRRPACARREYAFLSPSGDKRRVGWDRILKDAGKQKLSEAAGAFTQLTGEDPEDAAAWYNLGLARAWLGENK